MKDYLHLKRQHNLKNRTQVSYNANALILWNVLMVLMTQQKMIWKNSALNALNILLALTVQIAQYNHF